MGHLEERMNMRNNPVIHSLKPTILADGRRRWCCPHCMEKAKKAVD